ncbi:MAG: hypothetical protein QOH30_3927 [Baekduia sp.]|nr:hypothetical protein [Baekduia sp.]
MSAPPVTAPPPPLAEIAGGRTPSRGWIPAAVLVGGLAGVAAIVASAAGVSVSALHHIHADAASLHDVGALNVTWPSASFNPFVEHRLRIVTLVLTVPYLCAVTALGSIVIGAVRGSARWPRLVRPLAGFLPGYLMVLAPLQLLFAAVPLVAAAWIAALGVPAAALAVHRRAAVAAVATLRADRATRRGWSLTALGAAGVVGVAAIHRLQAGRNFMVPDSVIVFLGAAASQVRGDYGSHLLQWNQQSDEWVFDAPLMFTSHASHDYLFPLYASECLGLASFACLVFGLVSTFAWRRRALAASVATGAVLMSTPAILPWFYIALVGGQNPTLWLGHTGRYVGIVGPWMALLLLRHHRRRAAVALGFATLGLGFVSVHVTLYVLAALGAALAWERLRGRRPAVSAKALPRAVVHGLAALALAAPVFAYWLLHRIAAPSDAAWWLVAGAALALAGALLVNVATSGRRVTDAPTRTLRRAGAWAATLAAGFAVSNNLTDGVTGGHLRSVLGAVLPGYGTSLESRKLLGDTPTTGLSFPTFTGQECQISGHCLSSGYFLAGYGFLTIVALATWAALGPVDADGAANRRRAAWLLMVGALGLSFVLVDFTGAPGTTAWIFTRFLEVPYYGLLALAAMAFAASRDRLTRAVGLGVLALWTVVPVVVNLVPVQLMKNAHWLARTVVG